MSSNVYYTGTIEKGAIYVWENAWHQEKKCSRRCGRLMNILPEPIHLFHVIQGDHAVSQEDV